jgi:hypothetical protein
LTVFGAFAAYFLYSETVCFLGRTTINYALFAECLIFWQRMIPRDVSNPGEKLAMTRKSANDRSFAPH